MRDLTSPSEMLRQDARDQRTLRDEQTARWCDEDAIGVGTTEEEEDTIDDRLVDATDAAEDDEWDGLCDEDDR